MVIKRMNSIFHKHSRWLFGIFTVVIIVSFLGFLTPGRFGFEGMSSPLDRTVGIAYGQKITYGQLFERMRVLAMLQGGNSEINEESAFWTLCLDVKAKQMGVTANDADVISALQTMPFLRKDGKYSPEAYKNWLALLRVNGMTEEDMFTGIRCLILRQKLFDAVSGHVTVTDSEVKAFYREKNTVYTGKVYTFAPVVEKSEFLTDEVKNFFEKNQSRYMMDGNVEAALIEFPFAAYRDAAKKAEKDTAKAEEKAQAMALEAANNFAFDIYDALKGVDREKQFAAFQDFLKNKKMQCKNFKFAFNRDKSVLKSGEIALLDASDPVPVSDAFVQDKNAVVGFIVRRVDPRPAKFEEVIKKVFDDFKADRTHTATVKKVKDFSEKLAACKTAAERDALLKKVPASKTEDITFSEAGENPPINLIRCAYALISLNEGEAAAIGDQLAVLTKRTAPAAEMTGEEAKQYRQLCQQQKFAVYCSWLDDDINAHCTYNGTGENRHDR